MVPLDVGTRKSIFTLLIVMCCFGVLWPKVFYPMLKASFSMFSSEDDIRESNYFPARMRESMGESRPEDRVNYKSNARLLSHPSARWGPTLQTKGSGAFGILMPFYTIAIAVFFGYTILKLLLKKPCPNAKLLLEKSYVAPNGCRVINVSPAQCREQIPPKSPVEKLQPDNRTKQLLEEYGKEKVINALKTLIEEMADGKASSVMEKWKSEQQTSRRRRNQTVRQAALTNSAKWHQYQM